MARVIIRLPRDGPRKARERNEYFAHDEEHDFHTEWGAIRKEALADGGVQAVGKERFLIYPASWADRYARLERGAQIITPKDLGLIIAETGIAHDTTVLDIGAGSGAVTAALSRIAKHVYAYDVEKAAVERARANATSLGEEGRWSIEQGDAYDPATIPQENIDVFILDVPEPWRALATAQHGLAPGGWLVAYTPCITQVEQLVERLEGWHHVRTCEVIQRDWKVQGRAVRPMTRDFGHTAFLTFLRRV